MSKSRRVGGGKDQFKWDDVAKDPQRGNYLGNTLFTSQQKSFSNPNPREVDFYLKDPTAKKSSDDVKDEMAAIKAQEAEMMAKLLGLPPPAPSSVHSSSSATEDYRPSDKESRHKSRDSKHKHKHKHKKRERSPSQHRDSRSERRKSSPSKDSPPRYNRDRSPHREEERKRRRPSTDSIDVPLPPKRSKYED